MVPRSLTLQIPSKARVTGSLPSPGAWPARSNEGLGEALTGADIVVIPAGIPRKPGMSRDDLFNVSAIPMIFQGRPCLLFCSLCTVGDCIPRGPKLPVFSPARDSLF
jgi:hypothetical protein